MSTTADQSPISLRERRHTPTLEAISPEELIARHIEDAREQLAEGRERLKAARRRVVQLEDAVTSWERLAGEMRVARSRDAA